MCKLAILSTCNNISNVLPISSSRGHIIYLCVSSTSCFIEKLLKTSLMLQLSLLMCYSVWGTSTGLFVAVCYQEYIHPTRYVTLHKREHQTWINPTTKKCAIAFLSAHLTECIFFSCSPLWTVKYSHTDKNDDIMLYIILSFYSSRYLVAFITKWNSQTSMN